jgi:hypothetical protein
MDRRRERNLGQFGYLGVKRDLGLREHDGVRRNLGLVGNLGFLDPCEW